MEGHKETENIEDLYYSQLVAAADEWESQFSLEDRLKLFNQQYMTSKEEVLHKLDLHIKYIEREDISIATAVKEGMSIIICLLTAILAIMIQKMM